MQERLFCSQLTLGSPATRDFRPITGQAAFCSAWIIYCTSPSFFLSVLFRFGYCLRYLCWLPHFQCKANVSLRPSVLQIAASNQTQDTSHRHSNDSAAQFSHFPRNNCKKGQMYQKKLFCPTIALSKLDQSYFPS